MALTHPDDLRADADHFRAQAAQLREIAEDLDRQAAARDAAALRNAAALARAGRSIRYRVESNTSRTPFSEWAEQMPTQICADLNLGAYHAGRGGEYGIYDSNGERADVG